MGIAQSTFFRVPHAQALGPTLRRVRLPCPGVRPSVHSVLTGRGRRRDGREMSSESGRRMAMRQIALISHHTPLGVFDSCFYRHSTTLTPAGARRHPESSLAVCRLQFLLPPWSKSSLSPVHIDMLYSRGSAVCTYTRLVVSP